MSRQESMDYKPTSSLTRPLVATKPISKSPPKVVRSGTADVRERSVLRGASWKPRKLELDSEHLSIIIPSSNKRTRIPLSSVAAIDRTDLTSHSLSIRVAAPQTKERRLHLSFAADAELYDWQDDIYNRAPQLGGYSSTPFGFVHKAHVGADVEGNFGDSSVLPIYAEIVGGGSSGSQPAAAASTSGAASPKASTLIVQAPRSRPASGIITLPVNVNKTPSPPASVIPPTLEGRFLVAQSGVFSRWFAKMRWISLTGQVLTIHRGADKTSPPAQTIPISTLKRIIPETKRKTTLLLEFTPKAARSQQQQSRRKSVPLPSGTAVPS
ncbi:hypothetical protein BDN70DRAFT_554215 [Pholiota conissans]|uniref:CRIB domain-containing protein n=1 Tax=Pholiota conissans TaxID=109636 RepID=A0A9P5Z8B3_9AGAR|nr:hypothetical protein BDN70DRAFT_554215 [Pholiota conissans]